MTAAHPQASELLLLAERVEAATGPDRELDGLIRCLTPRSGEYNMRPARRAGAVTADYESGRHSTFLSFRYTSSLDAAMTLVPEGWGRIEYGRYDGADGYWASITFVGEGGVFETSTCASVPLALTAASLRALAAGGAK